MQSIFLADINFPSWLGTATTAEMTQNNTHVSTRRPHHSCSHFIPFSSCYPQQKLFDFLSLPNSICCVYVSTHKYIIPPFKISAFSLPLYLFIYLLCLSFSFLSFSTPLSLFPPSFFFSLLLWFLPASLSFLPLPFLFSLSINRESNSSRLIC